MLTAEQAEVVNDSDAVCACGADPKRADDLSGWFIDSVLTAEGRVGQVCCPACW